MGFDKILKNNTIEKLKNINRKGPFIPEGILKQYSSSKKSQISFENDSSIISEKKCGKSKSCENILYNDYE